MWLCLKIWKKVLGGYPTLKKKVISVAHIQSCEIFKGRQDEHLKYDLEQCKILQIYPETGLYFEVSGTSCHCNYSTAFENNLLQN